MDIKGRSPQGLFSVWLVRGLCVAAVLSWFYFFSWWGQDQRYHSPILWVFLILALIYSLIQMVANWWLYLVARYPQEPPPRKAVFSVDVFIPVCGEDAAIIERTLSAACRMRGPHKTWLLDDGPDPELAQLAKRWGAGYLTRGDRKDFKAGNMNAALSATHGDIIAIFDIDHVPQANFLERTVGHFVDPKMGFVQVMLSFSNFDQSWVARASAETSLDYYNPTSLGMDFCQSITLMGSNALIRRKALKDIHGYQPGLAEDLATSIALHSAGWQSAYVAEPLAPGMAPPDLTAWFVQQLKWARGVFDLLLTALPANFKRLSNGQRLSYAVRMTKYWIGPVVALHLFATIAILSLGDAVTRLAFHSYLHHLAPLVICDVALRSAALRVYCHPSVSGISFFSAIILVYASWPVYLLAWSMALFHAPLAFQPTPKEPSGKLNRAWLLPQALTIALLLTGTLYTIWVKGHPFSLTLGFAILQATIQLYLLYRWMFFELRPARSNQIPGNAPAALSTEE